MPLPNKHPQFITHTEHPVNGGVPLPLLREHAITPNDRFFVRNHGTIPVVDPARYRLTISGLVDRPFHLRLDQLQHEFQHTTLTATLQCAGNRRTELLAVAPIPGELPWGAEAIGNACWTGVCLRDVLAAAGVQPHAQHVAFAGLDDVERQGETFGFGSSITLRKALSDEVLLAHAMNGEPLSPAHGFPLRVIVPGNVSARSVKWLGTIHVQTEPSPNYFQQRAYRLFAPHERIETVHWDRGLMLNELGVNAVICEPEPHAMLPTGPLDIRGYAMAGGERTVARVDLSIDGGATWTQAQLEGFHQSYAWQLWHVQLDLPMGDHEIIVRAFDSAANTQPADLRDVWNFKGYMNNAWHRVRVCIQEA